MGTYAQSQHDDRDAVVDQGEIDIVHDQDLLISEARLSVDVGLTRRFGASLMVPFRIVHSSIRYLDGDGREVQLVTPNIHHRNETVSGLADPMVLGGMSLAADDWRFVIRAGATLPLGGTEDNPFTLGDLGLSHQHIQRGTGTVNPVVTASAARAWDQWNLGAFALTQQVVYENSKGYQAGDRFAAGVGVTRRMATKWTARGTIDALGETAETWDGIEHTDDGNRGRFDLIVGAGASWAASATLGFDAALKIPLVTHAVGGQLSMPALIEIGASWSFGGPDAEEHAHDHGHEHEHGHEHDHGHGDAHSDADANAHADADADADAGPDTAGLDISDLGEPGQAVDLVPIADKITIFDFWAEWCVPCKKLEPVLVELARRYPTQIAIRRIDAVDWDSAAVARYLTPKRFGLPHLKVFDRVGTLVLERSSGADLDGLIETVRRLIEAEVATPPRAPPR